MRGRKIISASVVGEGAVVRDFENKESQFRRALRRKMEELADEVKSEAQTLAPQKTGKLKRGFRRRVTESSAKITARIYTTWYGRFVEEGTGPVVARVKEYYRRSWWVESSLKKGKLTRSVRRRTGAIRLYLFKGKRGKEILPSQYAGLIHVREFSRLQRTAPRPFLRFALESMEATIVAGMAEVRDQVLTSSGS